MGCIFNLDTIHEFGSNLEGWQVLEKIRDFGITNLKLEEAGEHVLCSELCRDYNEHRANFMSYIRPGMDARVLWEWRKSAVLWNFMEGDKDPWFFKEQDESWGIRDIKDYRSRILATKFVDYEDHDWQYFWVLETAYNRDVAYEYFDMEQAYLDGDPYKVDDLGDPPADLAWRLGVNPNYEPLNRQGRPKIWGNDYCKDRADVTIPVLRDGRARLKLKEGSDIIQYFLGLLENDPRCDQIYKNRARAFLDNELD